MMPFRVIRQQQDDLQVCRLIGAERGKFFGRLIQIPQLVVGEREIQRDAEIDWSELHRLPIFRDGLFVVACSGERHSEIR